MRTRVLVAAAALLAVTLSGCTEANYLNPYGAAADDDETLDAGNETGNTTAPPAQNGTPPAPAPQGTFAITAPANFTVNETFEVQLNFYYPGNEPRAPVYGNSTNSTGNATGNGTDNRTVVDPGQPGTPAYHDDAWWVLNVTQGNVTLSFNGTSVPAKVTLSLNLSMNATLHGTYERADVNLSARATVPLASGASSAPLIPTGPALVISGSTSAPGNPTTSLLFGASGCAGFNAGENEVDCVFGAVPAALEGRTFTFESTAGSPDYEFWDSCDPVLGLYVQEFGGPATGTIPAGVGCVIMWNYGSGTGSFTFTVA